MNRSVPFLVGLLLAGLAFWLLRDYGAEAVRPRAPAVAAKAPPSQDPKEPGDTLVVLYGQEPDTLNPVTSRYATSEIELIDNLLPQLTWSSFEDCRLTFEPFLATSWEWSPDRLSLTYRIRKDMAWDDGIPLTAADVVFSYELYADPRVDSMRRSSLERMRRPPAVALDDFAVRFDFTEAYDEGTMLSHSGMNLVPRHLLEKADRPTLGGHPYGRAPVGTGPFKFKRWKPGEEVVLERNPAARGRRVPLLNSVVVRQVPENAARIAELLAGRADLIEGILETDLEPVLETGEYRIVRRGMRALEYIAWNGRNPLFADREVRRALTMAIDRNLLLKALVSGGGICYGQPAVGSVSPLHCEAYAGDVVPLPFDPDAAAGILEQRGWKDIDGDGLREKGGQAFSFTLMANSENARRRRIQELVRPMLEKVGVRVEIRDFPTNLWTEKLDKRDFEAAIGGRSASLFLDLTPEWHSGEGNKFNFASYSNPQVDALIEGALREHGRDRAATLWKQVQRLVYEDQPFTFLFWRDHLVPIHRRFRDVRANALSTLFELEEWWVPKADQKYR